MHPCKCLCRQHSAGLG